MNFEAAFWLLIALFSLYLLVKMLSRTFGMYHWVFRKRFFVRSFGVQPTPITLEKVEIVEKRLTELLDEWRPWLSEYTTLRAYGVNNSRYLEVVKKNAQCRDQAWAALASASDYSYYCTIPFHEQFGILIDRNLRAIRD